MWMMAMDGSTKNHETRPLGTFEVNVFPTDDGYNHFQHRTMSLSSAGNPLSASANDEPFGRNDVLCSPGSERDLHPGNERFIRLLAQYKPDFVATLSDPVLLRYKSPQFREALLVRVVAVKIVEEIRDEHGGRFLIKDPNTGLWVDGGTPKAIFFTGTVILKMTKNEREDDPPSLSSVLKVVIILVPVVFMVAAVLIIFLLVHGKNVPTFLGFLQLMLLMSIVCSITIKRICGPAPATASITTERHPRQLPLRPSFELVSQTQPYPPLEGPLEEAEDDDDDEIHQHGMSLFDKFSKEDDNNDCQREIQQESDEKSNGYLDDPPTTKEMEIV
jgi:hypothetical protein